MLSSSRAQQQSISRGLLLSVFYPLHFTVSQATRINNIFSENKKLRKEVAELTTTLSQLREEAVENERLRELLGFKSSSSYDLIPARVVVREPSIVVRSVVLNVGRTDSIVPYMPVISKDGIIGKITQVLQDACFVQLLRDPAARTSVMSTRTRMVGILETENGQDFFVRYRTHIDMEIGDEIVTSGLGGVFPRGLPVGRVSSIRNDTDPLFKRVHVEVSADFEHIDEVFVMRLSPQWASFISQIDSVRFEK